MLAAAVQGAFTNFLPTSILCPRRILQKVCNSNDVRLYEMFSIVLVVIAVRTGLEH